MGYLQVTRQKLETITKNQQIKFDDCTSEILKNLAAKDSSDSKSNAMEDNLWTKSNKKFLNMMLRHLGITVIKQQFEFITN